MRKIAHVTATFPPYYAGTGTICFENARFSAEAGYDVTVYTARNGGEPDQTTDGVKIKRLPYQLRLGNAALLGQLLALPKYDLVHLHYPFLLSAELIWLKHRLTQQPYVVTYHNDLVWDGWKGLLFRLYQTTWTRLVLMGACKVLVSCWDSAHSSAQLEFLMHRQADRFVELPNAVDAEVFHPGLDGTPIRRRFQIGENNPVVLFVGAMDAAHSLKGGVPVLLNAVARVAEPRVTLLLVGGGDQLPAYERLAKELGIGAQTKFSGWVPHHELGPYYAAADVVVVPSVRIEAFGMVVIEALACARPVIASELPGLRSVVRSTQGGVLVPPGNAEALSSSLADLLADPANGAELGRIGRLAVERKYALPVIGQRLVQVYEEVFAERATQQTAAAIA